MNKFMAPLMKWVTRSTALLVGIALVVIAFGFAIGKIGSLSIQIQHPLPDFEFEIRAPAAAAPVPAATARANAPSSRRSAPVTHPGTPQNSRSREKATFQAADDAPGMVL
jgi:hypothetical protein